jgi:hypothetical protein
MTVAYALAYETYVRAGTPDNIAVFTGIATRLPRRNDPDNGEWRPSWNSRCQGAFVGEERAFVVSSRSIIRGKASGVLTMFGRCKGGGLVWIS